MNKKNMIGLIVGGSLALAAVFGAVTAGGVKAQASTPTTPTPSAPAAPASQAGNPQPGPGRGMQPGGASEQDLATALGIGLDKLQTAETAATTEALKEAVAAGLITQAQSDQFAQNTANGAPMRGLPFLQGSPIDYEALLAQALGISADQLKAARQTADFAALDLAVQNGTMTQAQADEAKANMALTNSTAFQSAMKSAYEAALNQAVTAGTITQAQADLLIKNDAGMPWGGMGGQGHPGGPGGRGGPGGPNPNAGTPPAVTQQ